ncbi:hypothetical protein L0F63_003225 [Massospora cicadina]|nr:hypothetical protein L0F63_003225 [Massospora cicadina]
MSSEDFFPPSLSLISPVQCILEDWGSKLYEKPSIALPALNSKIAELSQGLLWFKPNSEPSPAAVEIDGKRIQVGSREKSTILRLSKSQPINKRVCHGLLKHFAASRFCRFEWKAYLGAAGPSDAKVEGAIMTRFLRFYYDERVASLELLLVVFECHWDLDHPCHLICSDLVHKFYPRPVELLGKLFDQLFTEVVELTAASHTAFQHFREQRSLLALVLVVLKHGGSFGAAEASKYFAWLFSPKKSPVDCQALHAAARHERLHADRLHLVLLYRLLKIDALNDPNHLLHSSPQTLDQLVRAALLAPPSPNGALYSMALALMSKAALAYFDGQIPQEPASRQLYDVLVNPNRALGATFNHSLYPHIDADLAVVFYCRAHNLDFFAMLEPLLAARACPRGSFTLAVGKDLFSLLASMVFLFPEEVLAKADQFLNCIGELLRGNDALCAYFWRAQGNSRRFRVLLDFARASYPANPRFLPCLLGALVGSRQAQRVASYFGSLVSLTQPYSPLISRCVDSVLDPELDLSILEATAPIQIHPEPRKTAFAIPLLTRGVLSDHPNGDKFVTWSVLYNGWDFLLCQMDNLLCEDDPLAKEHLKTLVTIRHALGLLAKVLTTSPGQLRHLFTCQPSHYEVGSDLHFVYQLIALCEFCFLSRDPPKGILSVALALLPIIFPLYPVVIGNFLTRATQFFNGAASGCTTLAQILLCSRSRPDALPVVAACLALSGGCISFLLDKAGFHQQVYSRNEPLPQLALAALRMVLVDVYPHYLSWCYLDPDQRSRIGIQCFDLFVMVLEAGQSNSPVLQGMVSLVTECFFQYDNDYMMTPILSIITIGRELMSRHEASGHRLQASLAAELLVKALRLLALLLKRLALAAAPDLADHWVLRMLQDRGGYSCDLVGHIIKLVTATHSQPIAHSATEVISLLTALCSADKLASRKLNLAFSSLTQEFGLEVRDLILDVSIDPSLKQSVWNLLSCLANARSHYLASLLGMADALGPPHLVGLIETTLEDSRSLVDQATPDVASFFCFLKQLWKHHPYYAALSEKIALPLQLWELAKNILTLDATSNPHLASIQANLCQLVGFEIQRLAASDAPAAPPKFHALVSFITQTLPATIRAGLALEPRPASLQRLNRFATAADISFASLEACIAAPGGPNSGLYSLDRLGMDAATVARALGFLHYGQEVAERDLLLECIEQANRDIIDAHVHRQLFHEQTKLACRIFRSAEVTFKDEVAMVDGLKGLLRGLVDAQPSLRPPAIHPVGIADLARLMAEIAGIVYERCAHFRSPESAALLVELFDALLGCQAWVKCEDYAASAPKLVHHLKLGWYQAISGTLMALGRLKAYWGEGSEGVARFHRGFEWAVEMAADELPKFMPTLETPMLSVTAKMVDMLVSLFQVDMLPATQTWAEALLAGNIPDTLLQMFVRFATVDHVGARLFSHGVAKLLACLSGAPRIAAALVEGQVLPKVAALMPQLHQPTKVPGADPMGGIVRAQVLIACLELCTQLYASADLGYGRNREAGSQTDELLAACAPIVDELFRPIWLSAQVGFLQLPCVEAAVKFITSLDPDVLPARAALHWGSLADQLSPLLSCLVDTLLLPGALAKRVASPLGIEVQLAQRFAMAPGESDHLARVAVDRVNLQLLRFFNARWRSLQILTTNPAHNAHPLTLVASAYNRFGTPLSFGTLLECVAIYTPAFGYATQSMEPYFSGGSPGGSQSRVPSELIARVDTAASLLSQALILLLAQAHLLLTSGAYAPDLKSNLMYDLQQELSPQLQAVLPPLRRLVAWFPRRPAAGGAGPNLPRTLGHLTRSWKWAHQHLLAGSYQCLGMGRTLRSPFASAPIKLYGRLGLPMGKPHPLNLYNGA